jgi:hypothetical protein
LGPADTSSSDALAEPNPRQGDIGTIETPTVKNATGSVHREFNGCPVSMEFDQSAAIDGPQ